MQEIDFVMMTVIGEVYEDSTISNADKQHIKSKCLSAKYKIEEKLKQCPILKCSTCLSKDNCTKDEHSMLYCISRL